MASNCCVACGKSLPLYFPRARNMGYCWDCWEEFYRACAQCGEPIPRPALSAYCEHCAGNRPDENPMTGPLVALPSARCFGLEVETSDCAGGWGIDLPYWSVKEDCSISGLEFYSGILYGDHGLSAIDAFCDHAASKGWEVDSDCGLHLHMDMRTEPDAALRGVAGAYCLTEGVWAQFVDHNRHSTGWCDSIRWNLSTLEKVSARFQTFCRRTTRFTWLNLQAFDKYMTFEIRSHEGTLNAQAIKNWVRAHLIFTDYASDLGTLEAVCREFESLTLEGQFNKIASIWDSAGANDLTVYYGAKREAGAVLV